MRDGIGLICALLWGAGLVLSMPCEASAQMLDLADTESLVRAVYYEGMPVEEAEKIGPEGCERLVEMLEDPSEAKSHGQILVAIGICAPPAALEALTAWETKRREGEIDRATFRAWQALPIALSHLARRDARAVSRLEERLNDAVAPDWTFRHHRGARLVRQKRRAAATCLAMTGLPEAGHALDRANAMSSDASFDAHLLKARRKHRLAQRAARRAARGGNAR